MEDTSSGLPLTKPDFWDDVWLSVQLPRLPDRRISYERCFLELFERHLAQAPCRTVFEAGCAPGMWLAYFARHFGYRPYGCDTSARGVALTRENLRLCGVEGEVLETDICDYRGGPFDVVYSLGLIEHFSRPAPVLGKHVELLKPGGTLVLGLPNLVGLNAWLAAPSLLPLHNQAVMSLGFLQAFAREHGLQVIWAGYLGGFEPANLGPPDDALLKRGVVRTLRRLRSLPGMDHVDSRWWSGFLAGVFRRPDDTSQPLRITS